MSELLGLGAHHQELGAHVALPRRTLVRVAGDGDERPALAHGPEQGGGHLAADGVQREVDASRTASPTACCV